MLISRRYAYSSATRIPPGQKRKKKKWKINFKSALKNAHFLIKDALFSCRSANLPENTSRISRGIQWKISRHSLENIEIISWHSIGKIKAIIGTYRKYKGNPIENIKRESNRKY